MKDIFKLFDSFKDETTYNPKKSSLNVECINKLYTEAKQFSKYKLYKTKNGYYRITLYGDFVEEYDDLTEAKQEFVIITMSGD